MRVARLFSLTLRLAVIGGGSLAVSGAALADGTVTLSSTDPQSIVEIQSESTMTQSETTTEVVRVDGASMEPTIVETAAAPTATPSMIEAVDAESASSPETTSLIQVALAADVIALPSQIEVSQVQKPMAITYRQTESAPATYASPQVGSTTTQPASTSPVTSVPKPLEPIGAIGSFLAFFANALPMRNVATQLTLPTLFFALIIFASFGFVFSRRYEASFGSWLKLFGYAKAGASSRPAPLSLFGTPIVMGYVCAPAPYA